MDPDILHQHFKLCIKKWFFHCPKIQHGVREGDLLSSCLFIMVLEILTINIRSNKNNQGIMVDGEEIKLEFFADDLTAFLLNDTSLAKFLDLLEDFGECSGLRMNQDKSEIMLLWGCSNLLPDHLVNRLEIKMSVKILGIHFMYDLCTKRKLNCDDLIKSIKEKLRIWRWGTSQLLVGFKLLKLSLFQMSYIVQAWYICMSRQRILKWGK